MVRTSKSYRCSWYCKSASKISEYVKYSDQVVLKYLVRDSVWPGWPSSLPIMHARSSWCTPGTSLHESLNAKKKFYRWNSFFNYSRDRLDRHDQDISVSCHNSTKESLMDYFGNEENVACSIAGVLERMLDWAGFQMLSVWMKDPLISCLFPNLVAIVSCSLTAAGLWLVITTLVQPHKAVPAPYIFNWGRHDVIMGISKKPAVFPLLQEGEEEAGR